MSEWVNVAGWRDYLVGRGISEPLATEWARYVRRGIALSHTSVEAKDQTPIGASKFGGHPDLPSDFVWPSRPVYGQDLEPDLRRGLHPAAREPAPLRFLAQIDLAEVARIRVQLPVPREGLLLFFYDGVLQPWGIFPEDRACFSVLYVAPGTQLVRREGPAPAYPCAPMLMQVRESLPTMSWVHERLGHTIGMTHAGLAHEMAKLTETDHEEMTHEGHGLGGRPAEIQYPMEWDCQKRLSALPDDARPRDHLEAYRAINDWHLLAQFDTDLDLDWEWADSGKLYFWSRWDDIAARRFDAAWLLLQCY